MLSADQLPTLWDPEELFSHLAIWAGVPAATVAVVAGLLAIKGWKDFGKATGQGFKTAQENFKNITTERQRAAVRLVVCSVLAVALAYMLAVIVNALVQVAEANELSALYSSKVVEHAVVATQWSPASVWTMILGVAGIGLLGIACIAGLTTLRKLISFLGGLACAVAWVAGVAMGIDAIIGFAILGFHSQDPPPMSLLVTQVITAVLCLAVGWLLPKIRKANRVAFNSP